MSQSRTMFLAELLITNPKDEWRPQHPGGTPVPCVEHARTLEDGGPLVYVRPQRIEEPARVLGALMPWHYVLLVYDENGDPLGTIGPRKEEQT